MIVYVREKTILIKNLKRGGIEVIKKNNSECFSDCFMHMKYCMTVN